MRDLDAFIVRERNGRLRQTVYLNRDSAILQSAVKGSDSHLKVLAAVIHHEACHLKGCDEAAARQAERRFFRELVAKGLVSTSEGFAYLELLKHAHMTTR